MSNLITGLFDTSSKAETAVSQLKQHGYGQNEVTIIMKDRNAAENLAHETGSRSLEGIGTGAAIGGTIGAVLAGLLAVGTVTIPGVGLIAAGSLAAMLAGAGAGGLTGGLIGWLASAGIPEDIAPYYESGLNSGGVLVAVGCHINDEQRVQEILQGNASLVSGRNTPTYISPEHQSRISEKGFAMNTITPTNINSASPPTTANTIGYDSAQKEGYDTATTAHEAQRTTNDIHTDQRTMERDTDEHERESRRDASTTGPVSGLVNAVKNSADRAGTALENEADRAGNSLSNTADKVNNP